MTRKNQWRPFKIAESFLETFLEQNAFLEGERLPSTRSIAAQLDISEGTVRNVINKFQKEGRLEVRHGSGVYVRRRSETRRYPFHISCNIREPSSAGSAWMDGIINAMIETLVRCGSRVSFASFYAADELVNELPKHEIERRCLGYNGFILTQGDPHLLTIIEHCRANKKPFVTLNALDPVSSANFVSTQSYAAHDWMARALVAAGRKRFALFVYPDVQISESMALRLAGTVRGIGSALGGEVELRVSTAEGVMEKHGRESLRKMIDEEGYMPDALIFGGDYLAAGALELLRERGISVPKEACVIAGAGVYKEVKEQMVTSFIHPVRDIGVRLATLLMQLLETDTLSIPGVYLPLGLLEGRTTTEEENRLLREHFGTRAVVHSPIHPST